MQKPNKLRAVKPSRAKANRHIYFVSSLPASLIRDTRLPSTNEKKSVLIRTIRQIRGKTKQNMRLCAFASRNRWQSLPLCIPLCIPKQLISLVPSTYSINEIII
jgi:hypothetical protein